MNKFDLKLGSAIAIAAFVGTVVAPVGLADTTIDVEDNGANSTNNVTVNDTTNSTVTQTNNSTIVNTITVEQNTGNNSASGNTGGDNGIVTGNARSNVEVSVGGSANHLTSENCNDCASDTDVDVIENGARSDNNVIVRKVNNKRVTQTNTSVIVNTASLKQKTGKNRVRNNTRGTNGIGTGNTFSNIILNIIGSLNTKTVTP